MYNNQVGVCINKHIVPLIMSGRGTSASHTPPQFPSWSSINHSGRWKLLHYSARRFFAPVLTSGVFHSDTDLLEVHVTNDRPTDFNGAHEAACVGVWRGC